MEKKEKTGFKNVMTSFLEGLRTVGATVGLAREAVDLEIAQWLTLWIYSIILDSKLNITHPDP